MPIQLRHQKNIFLWQYNFDNLRPCLAHAATHKAWEKESYLHWTRTYMRVDLAGGGIHVMGACNR
jgi:hypothetical protein